MPDPSDVTAVRPPDGAPEATAVRPVPSTVDETLVRPAPQNPAGAQTSVMPPRTVSTGSAGFAEETRQLLRKRLLVTHGSIGLVTGAVAFLGLTGLAPVPEEAGLGRWAVGLPLLVFAQSVVGLGFLIRYPGASLTALRAVEVTEFGIIAGAGFVARFVVLETDAAPSPDARYHHLLYRFNSLMTGLPLLFAIVLYGVLIPNTRRRSLIGSAVLISVPLVATAMAAAANPMVRPTLAYVLPTTALPLFMAGVIAVFSAARSSTLQRQAFDAVRELKQLGAYTLRKRLGEGGMGEVWLAEHRLLKRPCAMKFVRADLASEPATAARFEREVRAVTGLTHFNTVRIYDYGRGNDGSFYYVMEYLEGPTLDRLVKDRGPLAVGRAVYLLRQLCGALSEAHRAGMVHRDLKPANIIIASLGGQRDVAKLLDFGLVQDHGSSSDVKITRAGTVLGTPAYMCPEQAAGESVDPRGDLYSLGAVAFFCLTGRPPFEGTSVGKLINAHLTQPAPDVRSVRPSVPADLAGVVAKCLAKEPAERFQTACALEAALAACACSTEWTAALAAQWWEPPTTGTASAAPSATLVL
ncbi:Serine/threonine-protein kinase PrkC [Gemmata obscuriglobus]|nr:serine/threonine-protein kinase [Gemmata obscuriglobus]QEG31311.1 Serine/threonine-protein kinase PrkC [Gemmata obscuriglobus]VTS10650.1 serine threonine protein kinase : Serine/threonine kinase OS=Planctomyces maris DSM 8797 GN=PM8797T_25836 PE=4 SV=1: Pkinase [Gemmata obscuriglobus UQM 2246]